jgi:hypothetical protein
LDKKEWRSFRVENVLDVKVIEWLQDIP